jgi:hypothetical protein
MIHKVTLTPREQRQMKLGTVLLARPVTDKLDEKTIHISEPSEYAKVGDLIGDGFGNYTQICQPPYEEGNILDTGDGRLTVQSVRAEYRRNDLEARMEWLWFIETKAVIDRLDEVNQPTCGDCRKFPDTCSKGDAIVNGASIKDIREDYSACEDFKPKDAEWFCVGCQAVVPRHVINEDERCLVCGEPVIMRIDPTKDPVEFVRTVLLALLDPPDGDEDRVFDGDYDGYCAVCGCTDGNGCSPDGCYWVAECVHKAMECINRWVDVANDWSKKMLDIICARFSTIAELVQRDIDERNRRYLDTNKATNGDRK